MALFKSYHQASVFAYIGIRRSAVMKLVGRLRLPCLTFVSFLWWYPADSIPSSYRLHTILGISISHLFDRFLNIFILAWNAYLVRSMVFVTPPSVYLGFAVAYLWFLDAWLMSHGFLVSISSDKVHHTVMILSFRMKAMITSSMIAIQKRSKVHLGICK